MTEMRVSAPGQPLRWLTLLQDETAEHISSSLAAFSRVSRFGD